MNQKLRLDADQIVKASIQAVMPDEAVARALRDFKPGKGRTILVSIGKAGWQMADAAVKVLGKVDSGIVITKYGHVKAPIPGVLCREAGHPVPDQNGFDAASAAIDLVSGLTEKDTVFFLISGGGSALFEKPLIPGKELQYITQCGYCGDQHHPQTAERRERRTLRQIVRTSPGVQHRSE